MAEDKKKEIDVAVIEVTEEYLKEKLYKIRGKRVLLDADLAEIYGYDTKGFNLSLIHILIICAEFKTKYLVEYFAFG